MGRMSEHQARHQSKPRLTRSQPVPLQSHWVYAASSPAVPAFDDAAELSDADWHVFIAYAPSDVGTRIVIGRPRHRPDTEHASTPVRSAVPIPRTRRALFGGSLLSRALQPLEQQHGYSFGIGQRDGRFLCPVQRWSDVRRSAPERFKRRH